MAEIPQEARGKVLSGVEAIYMVANKIALAYMDQMEEFQTVASEKEAQ